MNRSVGCWLFVISLFVTGCEPDQPKPPPKAKVAGTVTLDGSPMAEGEIRFNLAGQPATSAPVKGGAFAGEAYIGLNQVDVLMEREVPNPSMPGTNMKVNSVSMQFQGPNSPLKADVPAAGASDLKFEVTSAR